MNDYDPNRGAPDGLILALFGLAIVIVGGLGIVGLVGLLRMLGRDVF